MALTIGWRFLLLYVSHLISTVCVTNWLFIQIGALGYSIDNLVCTRTSLYSLSQLTNNYPMQTSTMDLVFRLKMARRTSPKTNDSNDHTYSHSSPV